MSTPKETGIEQLETTIATLEAQRPLLGDAVVETALAPLRRQLDQLQAKERSKPGETRRIITILFSDIVGSTALAEKLDPEEWRSIVGHVHAAAGEVVARHGGKVVQYLGDGLLALFGLERAAEFDPENAIRAALEIQASPYGPPGQPVKLRIGLHTGPVVIGELGSESKKELTASGDAMNLAARLQSAAPAGGVLISQDMYRHVRGVFDVTPQPPLSLKGKTEPVRSYLVRRAKPRPFRSTGRGIAGAETRTVGRERESAQLQQAYLDAYERRRPVWAQLIGEPGVGKSRLIQDMSEWLDLRPEPFWLLRARAYPADSTQPFALVRRMWFDRFQIAEDAPLAQAESKWIQRFQELTGSTDREPAQALGNLIGLPFNAEASSGAITGDPGVVKGRALVVSRELLARLRERQPVVLLLEDLEWADESSWEWLTSVLLLPQEGAETEGQVPENGLFVVGAARRDWHPPVALLNYPQYRPIDLAPLSSKDSRELVLELLQRVEGAPPQVIDLLVARSEGVPYFAEEMVNYFLDQGIIDRSTEPWRFVASRLKETPLPATLQHLLLTRLGTLGEAERAALQRGAIFGRNFWSGGVEALGVRESDRVLEPLQPRGLVEIQPESALEGQTEWSFHHALLRDVTYESVLKRERAELHKAAAQWLEKQAREAGRLEEFAGLLAEHAERAGLTLQAADWYLKAGERARQQGSMRDARRAYDLALNLLPPAEWERRFEVLRGREFATMATGERDLREQDVSAMLELAEAHEDSGRLAIAYQTRSHMRRGSGDWGGALDDAGKAIELARQVGDEATEIKAQLERGNVLVGLGECEPAAQVTMEGIERARKLGDREVLQYALLIGGVAFLACGDYVRGIRLQEELSEISKGSARLGMAISFLNLGASYIWLGQYKRARPVTEQGLELCRASGQRNLEPTALANLGEIYYFSGDYRTAQRFEEEALRSAEIISVKSGQAIILSELGLILLDTGDAGAAERRYARARQLAQEANLAFFEYGALAGMARCALEQGRLEEARQYAAESWTYFKEHGAVGAEHPSRVYLDCEYVFDALGEAELARTVVEQGYRVMMAKADKISDPEWRTSFLENDPFNRELVERWERAR